MSQDSFLRGKLRIIRIEARLTGTQSKSDFLPFTMVTNALIAPHNIAIILPSRGTIIGRITPDTHHPSLLLGQQVQLMKCLHAGELKASLNSCRISALLVSDLGCRSSIVKPPSYFSPFLEGGVSKNSGHAAWCTQENMGFGVRQLSVHVLTLLTKSCAILGKSLYLHSPQISNLYSGHDGKSYPLVFLWGLTEIRTMYSINVGLLANPQNAVGAENPV